MPLAQKIQSEFYTVLFTVLFLMVVVIHYGRQFIEWVLMTLYHYLIQRNPLRL